MANEKLSPFEKDVSIQPLWKTLPHSTRTKKPSSFNPYERAIPIQPIWKSLPIQPSRKIRHHPIQLKKSLPSKSFERDFLIRKSRFSYNPYEKSRPLPTHMKKPSPSNPYEKAVPTQYIWQKPSFIQLIPKNPPSYSRNSVLIKSLALSSLRSESPVPSSTDSHRFIKQLNE